MKWGNLLFALGVALAVLLITALLLTHIRRAGAAPLPRTVAAAVQPPCADLPEIGP